MIDDEKIRLQELSYKWLNGTLTDTEQLEFDSWFVHSNIGPLEVPAEVAGDREQYRQLIFSRIREEIGIAKPTKRTKLWPRIGVAAAVIGLAIGVYFYTIPHPELVSGSPNYANDIAPGKNTATLTSSNGKTINLSEAKTGVAIDATALSYNDGTKIDPSALGMTDWDSRALEVITPKGGTYSIILQDGTKVWLNADSKLEFLSNYRNKLQRVVKLTGEGYFEVAKVFSPGKAGRGPERVPFIVESNGQRVEVLGTHFNISAYKGEGIKTTLLEGSVRVASLSASGGEMGEAQRGSIKGSSLPSGISPRGGERILRPGEQSLITENGGIKVTEANIEQDLAWKNGYFRFNDLKIKPIMNQLSRWYDIEVIYEGEMPEDGFNGTLSRYKNISQVLTVLQATKLVHFKIEGRRVTVIH